MIIIPKDYTLHTLLNNPHEQFKVPSYQRRYAWQERQQIALFKDIDMLLSGDGHLFGMLILHTSLHHGGVNRVDVVDGQQRLTTVAILLLVLYNKFNQIGEDYNASQIAQLLFCGNPKNSKTPKLELGELDNADYLKLLDGNLDKVKNLNLLSAYNIFTELIKDAISNNGDDWLSEYYTKLVHTAKIIRLDVQQAQDAYKLFETINNRGLRLSATDILKNFILGHAAKISEVKLNEIKELWSELITELDGIPTDDFFRQYVSSVYTRKISSSKLIEEFKKHYFKNVLDVDKLGEYRYNYGLENAEELYIEEDENGVEAAEEFENGELNESNNRVDLSDYLKKIVAAAACYSKIWNRNFPDKKINTRIADLQFIKSFPSYIFLMHYLQFEFPKKEVYRVLDMIATLMLRRHMTGKSTSYNDDIFAKLLRIEFDDKHVEKIRESLFEDCPDDAEFEDSFPKHELKERVINRARYVLTKIEYHKTGNTDEFTINDPDEVHVEHIIPKTIDTKKSKREFGDWEVYLGDKAKINHSKNVNRIGNMTLLSDELNISASNNPFTKKKNSYRESNISITRELSEYPNFRINQIENRGQELAELAVKIWKL